MEPLPGSARVPPGPPRPPAPPTTDQFPRPGWRPRPPAHTSWWQKLLESWVQLRKVLWPTGDALGRAMAAVVAAILVTMLAVLLVDVLTSR